MITPIVVPVIVHGEDEEDVCPNCGKPEEIIEVCKHCKHEYIDDGEGITGWDILAAIGIIVGFLIVIFWFLVTLMDWLFMEDGIYGYKNSLRQELSEQVEWFKDIKF